MLPGCPAKLSLLIKLNKLGEIPWNEVKLTTSEIKSLQLIDYSVKTKLLDKTFDNYPRYKVVVHENKEDYNLDTRFNIAYTYGTWSIGGFDSTYVFVDKDKDGKLFLNYVPGGSGSQKGANGRVFFDMEEAEIYVKDLKEEYKHLQEISPWLNEMVEKVEREVSEHC